MRRLIDFGAGYIVVSSGISVIVGIPVYVILLNINHTVVSAGQVALTVALLILVALVTLGYFLLMKKLGAWNQGA